MAGEGSFLSFVFSISDSIIFGCSHSPSWAWLFLDSSFVVTLGSPTCSSLEVTAAVSHQLSQCLHCRLDWLGVPPVSP